MFPQNLPAEPFAEIEKKDDPQSGLRSARSILLAMTACWALVALGGYAVYKLFFT